MLIADASLIISDTVCAHRAAGLAKFEHISPLTEKRFPCI
jgi:hypothetical protein